MPASSSIRLPNVPARAEAPTSATLRASSMVLTALPAAGLTVPGGRIAASFPSWNGFAVEQRRHDRRLARRAPPRTADLRSAMAAFAACQPGMPQTPPPAWVAELP